MSTPEALRRFQSEAVPPTSLEARVAARQHIDALAKPTGALGVLEELAVWVAGCQDSAVPRELTRVRAVVFAGDHGVSNHGVSAYPRGVTAAMVRAMLGGGAAASVLARAHGVSLRVLDIGVDDALAGVPAEVRRYKINTGSKSIDLEDALSAAEVEYALSVGQQVADEEISAGADLLICGDMGIGNTTPAAALIAAVLGLRGADVAGRGTGIDDATLDHKITIIDAALDRTGERDPVGVLQSLGSADLAAAVGFLIGAARARVPVLLDGVICVAEALVAEAIAPGSNEWFAAGHRSTEPAQALAFDKLGLLPILDLGMRLGEGSGALTALPVLRSAVTLARQMSLLADLELS